MMNLLNFENPTRRDVAMLPGSGWTVIAFETDNPGAWLMHCHIGWHVGEGLSLQFLEVPSQIPGIYESATSDGEYQDTCATWADYYPDSVYPKSDNGLKRRNGNFHTNWALPQNHHLDVTRHLSSHRRRAKMPHEY